MSHETANQGIHKSAPLDIDLDTRIAALGFNMATGLQWKPHTRNIIFYCLLVTIPMIASSLAILALIFANLTKESCPSEELCQLLDLVNTTSTSHYYVDYPAARLAFISSCSSTISFALVGFLMAMYAYTNSASLLRASESADQQSLPSPHQMSVLLRILNAEIMMLWFLAISKLKRVFWNGAREGDGPQRRSRILEATIIVFMVGITARLVSKRHAILRVDLTRHSLLVQAADVYFHIAAESIELVQVQEVLPGLRHYSRGLAPWCLDRPNLGILGQKSFWGCAITAQAAPYNNATSLAPTNASIIQDLKNSNSDQHTILNFTDANRTQYAIVGPPSIDVSSDWKASSFGVSTTCSAIPENACNLSSPITNAKDGQGSPIRYHHRRSMYWNPSLTHAQ